MLGNSHFYNRTIRKIVVAFGTMFNDLYLVRYSKDGLTAHEKFKVPLNYGPKEKFITRLTSDPTLTKSIATSVPRMSFEMTSMSYDSSRKQVSTLQNFGQAPDGTINKQYSPIPYNYEFTLSIYVRNTEDGTQILEQILPFFTPDYTVSVNFIKEMGRPHDLPILLNDVSNETTYEGDMMDTRLIIWTLTFSAKSYIFPPVKEVTGGIIYKANTNFLEDHTFSALQKVSLTSANSFGTYITGEVIRVNDSGKFGTMQVFSNTNSSITMVVSDMNKALAVGDKVVGDYSRATYTVGGLETDAMKVAVITTTPTPNTAAADDLFGFAETINEFPDSL
jgi:hypothetical protein